MTELQLDELILVVQTKFLTWFDYLEFNCASRAGLEVYIRSASSISLPKYLTLSTRIIDSYSIWYCKLPKRILRILERLLHGFCGLSENVVSAIREQLQLAGSHRHLVNSRDYVANFSLSETSYLNFRLPWLTIQWRGSWWFMDKYPYQCVDATNKCRIVDRSRMQDAISGVMQMNVTKRCWSCCQSLIWFVAFNLRRMTSTLLTRSHKVGR